MQVKAVIANRQGGQGLRIQGAQGVGAQSMGAQGLGVQGARLSVVQGVGACRLSLMRSSTQSMYLSE